MDLNALKFRVGIDLAPILSGGENGGAKIMTLELIKRMSALAPNVELILLTVKQNHQELIALNSSNVTCICTDENEHEKIVLYNKVSSKKGIFDKLKNLWRQYWVKNTVKIKPLVIDVLYCPFTVSQYNSPEIPTVATIYDLQYHYYAAFFTPEEYYNREMSFKMACKNSSNLVCISNFVRQTVIENSHFDPQKVETVHIQMPYRLPALSYEVIEETCKKLLVTPQEYFLYPANFWPHKNHEVLLTAISLYCHRYPSSTIKLVCTGHADKRMEYLVNASKKMGIASRVIFSNFLTDKEFAGLISACKAVIFPSLYEGFGMPIIEAMAYQKPILCSNVTSLPEVANEAAIYFDPRKPQSIVQAIHQLETQSELVDAVIQRGKEQIKKFANIDLMAKQYLTIFLDAKKNPKDNYQVLQGKYADGWSSDKLTLMHGGATIPRFVELTLSLPEWSPQKKITIELTTDSLMKKKKFTLKRSQKVTIHQPLPTSKGKMHFSIYPAFVPNQLGMNNDNRTLSCLVSSCFIKENDKVIELC